MKQKSRHAELAERLRKRLGYLEMRMLSPPGQLTDAEYEAIQVEAIKLREMLKML